MKALLVILGILGAIALSGALQDHTAAALHHGLVAEASAGLLVHHHHSHHQAATVALPRSSASGSHHFHLPRLHVWTVWRVFHPRLWLPWWARGGRYRY